MGRDHFAVLPSSTPTAGKVAAHFEQDIMAKGIRSRERDSGPYHVEGS